jgi:hypothetical protein
MGSGYTDCACRDCFDVSFSDDVDRPELCHRNVNLSERQRIIAHILCIAENNKDSSSMAAFVRVVDVWLRQGGIRSAA